MAEGGKALPNSSFSELMIAVLEKGNPFRFQAAGASMSPFIRSGDVITLTAVHDRIHFGEVLALRQTENDRLAVHRVIGLGRKGFLLKGDNGGHADGRVNRERIIGRVTRVEHRGREVRIGLRFELILIAGLSRLRLLLLLVFPLRWLLRPVYKRYFA